MSSEEMVQTLEKCRLRRKIFKGQVTKFNTFLTENEANPDYDRIQARLEAIVEYFQEFKGIQTTLEEEEPEENHEEKKAEIEESYLDGIARAKRLIRTATTGSSIASEGSERSTPLPTNPQTCVPVTVTVPPRLPARKLPDLNPPAFDGKIENWATFKSRFTSMIDKNDGLTPSDKLEYLQSALTGKAARIIEALETTDSSYKDAWELLTAKYDNDRKAILRHWAILGGYPALQKDTAEALDDLVDVFRQQLRWLKNLGQTVSGWDTCIISLLLSKIGKGSAYQWELTLTDNKMPAYTSLLDFLAKRANCSDTKGSESHNKEPKQSSKQDNKPKGNSKPRNGQRQSYLTSAAAGNSSNQATECSLCKDAHYATSCPKLKDIPVEERIKIVQTAGLCLNCFRSNHKTKACRYEKRCKVCKRPHHTMLHLTQPGESSQPEA